MRYYEEAQRRQRQWQQHKQQEAFRPAFRGLATRERYNQVSALQKTVTVL